MASWTRVAASNVGDAVRALKHGEEYVGGGLAGRVFCRSCPWTSVFRKRVIHKRKERSTKLSKLRYRQDSRWRGLFNSGGRRRCLSITGRCFVFGSSGGWGVAGGSGGGRRGGRGERQEGC